MVNRILQLLQTSNMTAKELTEKLEIGKSSVTEWKNGRSKPTVASLIKISKIFGVSLDWLLTGADFSTYTLSIDEETLLDTYREMDVAGKKKLQKAAKNIWIDYRKE